MEQLMCTINRRKKKEKKENHIKRERMWQGINKMNKEKKKEKRLWKCVQVGNKKFAQKCERKS